MCDSQKQVDRERNNDKDQTKGQAKSEITLAGFQRNRSGHGARIHADIAAKHHGHTNLENDSSKTRNDGGNQPEANFPRQLEQALHIASPESAGGGQNPIISSLNRAESVIGDHWGGENYLTNDDGFGSKEKSHGTEWPLPTEETVDHEADYHGWHRHKAVQHKADCAFHRELAQSYRDANGNPGDGGKEN